MYQNIYLYDTTLRDGAQGHAVSFSLQDKIEIVRKLDGIGMHFIEAGNPYSNPKDLELFEKLKEEPLKNASLVAFGSTCRVGMKAQEDEGLKTLCALACPCVAIVGKSSAFHVREVLKTTPEENLRIISDSVMMLKNAGKTVFFDAEHFFDGYFDDASYALLTLKAAKDAGADYLILCDTNGGTLPEDVRNVIDEVAPLYPGQIGIHAHNDCGTAVACSLTAVRRGASIVQGSVNGLGERCGNADLTAVIPNLVLKMGIPCFPNLHRITELSQFVASVANFSHDIRMPYVGEAAFVHKGGMHIDGVMKNPRSFEHVLPEDVGNSRAYALSDLSGRALLLPKLKKVDPTLTRESPEVEMLYDRLKQMEFEGYSFEDAEDSFLLMVKKALGKYKPFYEALDFQVLCQRPEDVTYTMATIKVKVGEQVEITAAEGDGPVNALDCALRKALTVFYPQLSRLRLTDFKVRVVNLSGTASSVRVFIRSTDGKRDFGTVGVDPSILQAAWIALTDSVDAFLESEQ